MALNARASQEFVPIKEIQDGIVVLKDGGLRSVLMASSVNISLKSEDEQNAIIMQFQNFLNTLDFSVQISIQSRKYDVTSYLATLEEKLKTQTEPLLKIQTQEYMQFIQNFTDNVNIMTKHFFVVVPYTPATLGSSGGFLDKLLPSSKIEKDKKADFELYRSQLEQRVALVQQGLSRVGVRTVALKTDEEVELFYKVFNPGDAESKINFNKEQ
ncbi:MAG: hypothetical protein QG654_204 [Patescibacteria group bacterium]|jgi:hypothetical protein|nr:hypothetical protein [Patescibacteria group bacterium]